MSGSDPTAYRSPADVEPEEYPSAAAPVAPAAPAAPANHAAKKHDRKRILLISTAAAAVIALVAVGVWALVSGRSGDSAVAAVRCQPTDLPSCLIKAPAGAVRLADTHADKWPQQTTVGADLYGSNITKDAQGVGADTASQLNGDGLKSIVHAEWNAVDGDNIDLVVLAFKTEKGAQAWNAARAAEITVAYQGQTVAIPGDTAHKASVAAKADSRGNVEAAYTAVVGDLVLDVAYSSPGKFTAADLQSWAGAELATLRTAPAPAAAPADTAPATEQVACAPLSSCLEPMPSGAVHWTSPPSQRWVSKSTLTTSQYVQLFWGNQPSVLAQVQANFDADGVTGIGHQDWAVDSAGKQADIYVVQTLTGSGASRLNSTNFGEPDWSDTGLTAENYTIPGEAAAQAWRTNKADANGFVEFYFIEQTGNVIVEGWLDFRGSFDAATAEKWAKGELDLVHRGVTTHPLGMFPLNVPTLPAPSQGTCPSPTDCLMPAPHGTTDTTSKSYQAGESVSAGTYAAHYEPNASNDVGAWLAADGLKGAQHRSWTAGNGAKADAVLLEYAGPQQARAAAELEYGFNAGVGRICTDAAVPGSVCVAEPVSAGDYLQNQTIRVLAWKGDYEVSVSVTVSNAADVADAYTWALQQLNLLPAA